MTVPVVSVIVTTRNSARTLDACLRSIRGQTYPQIELVVVDNGSSDETGSIARSYADRVLDAGPERSAQRNAGVAASSGESLLIVDSDMVLDRDVVGACVACAADAVAIPEDSFGSGFWARCRSFERNFYHGDSTVSAARFFRRSAFLAAGGYDESLLGGEDWDLSMRVCGSRPLAFARALIHHDEGHPRLRALVLKKFYYARGYRRFARKHGREGARRLTPIRPALLRNAGEMLRHPVLGTGVVVMKAAEVAGFLAGLAMARDA
jgi:glycosyltransferase involved in cell wall biosynthesis